MPAVAFQGLATGLDSGAIINSLLGVERVPILRLQQKNSFNQAKIGIIDSLSSSLSNLSSKAGELDTVGEFLSFKGSVSDETTATVTASGDAVPGSYTLNVTTLASAQRTYSDAQASKTTALSASEETLSITIDGTTTDITITADATLEDVVGAINGSGADVTAGLMFDGTNYRLQVVGNSTGATNAITFADTGLGLGLETAGNTIQAAVDAAFTLDGFSITSADNLVSDVLDGVTISLDAAGAGDVQVNIAADSEAVQGKLQAFVDAYNSVASIINDQSGQGKGEDTLNGDSAVRTIQSGLSALVTGSIPGLTTTAGDTMQLADLGISIQADGTLTLDSEDLDEALAGGFTTVASYFAGDEAADVDGMGVLLDDLIETYTSTTDGLLEARKDGLNALIKSNDSRIEGLEEYLASYESRLQSQFIALESAMSALQTQQSYLAQFVNR